MSTFYGILVPLALALTIAGCSRTAKPASELPPQAETALKVENQNYLDMDIYVLRGGARMRVGMVPGLSSRIFMLRPEVVGTAAELRFEVHPIGGRQNPISETVTVHPGEVIELTIPPS